MRNLAWIGMAGLMLAGTVPPAHSDETSRLSLVVLTESSRKPVADAHVVIRFVKKKILKDKRTSWEAKTNRKGMVVLEELPLGSIKIQVIAKGYQTYGDEHELSKADEQVTVLLKLPQKQFSAY